MKTTTLIILSILVCYSLSSCAAKKTKELPPVVLYPAPPEKPKIQYLMSFSDSADIVGPRSGFLDYVAGKETGKDIVKPYGLTISNGRMYICDTVLGGLEIVDFNKVSFDYFQPKGRGQLKKPINVFRDKAGKLFVVDIERRQVVVFDENDKYVTAFGENDLKKPTDVFVDEDRVYVSDIKLRKIVVFSKETFKKISELPKAELPKEESLFSPTNVYVRNSKIYVSDFGDFKIKIYDPNGDFITSVGSYGKALGQFVRPKGIAVDRDSNLYVADAGFENVQIFDPQGKLLLFFGGEYTGPGGMWLPAKITLDYGNLKYFEQFVDKSLTLKYLIFVSNQYGPDKISVYGFVEEKGIGKQEASGEVILSSGSAEKPSTQGTETSQ